MRDRPRDVSKRGRVPDSAPRHPVARAKKIVQWKPAPVYKKKPGTR